MKSVSRWIMGLVMAACAMPVGAQEVSPVGLWTLAGGDSRYEVALCGDGTQLCAKLVWLREDAATPENTPYLNTYLVEKATLVRPYKWKGEVHLWGKTLGGTVTMTAPERIEVRGCYLILCKSYKLEKTAS